MGSTTPPENIFSLQKRVVGNLTHGLDLATQLQALLREPFSQPRSLSADDLVVKILTSFTETLSVLRCYDRHAGAAGRGSAATASRNCMGVVKNRRGCYKRRKNTETKIVVSCTTEDGHAWRKYGQKEILNAKFPRSYYRCTRKHEEGCRAMKQVQRMEGDIVMFHTTYIGHHTCRDILKAPQLINNGGSDKVAINKAAASPEKVDVDQEMKPAEEGTVVLKEETVQLSDDLGQVDSTVSSMDKSTVNLWAGWEGLEDSYMPAAPMVSPRSCSDIYGVDCTMFSRNIADMSFLPESLGFHFDENFHFF